MSDHNASPSKGSVLTNLDTSTTADTSASPGKLHRSASATPEEHVALERTNSLDHSFTQKDPETEGKKRKRSQRACIRCRGQKLKCDGVFPCARCLKLKLICKEPSDAGNGTPSSSKFSSDERESKGNFSTTSSRTTSHLHSHTPQSAGHISTPASGSHSSTFAVPAHPDARPDLSHSSGPYAASTFQHQHQPSEFSGHSSDRHGSSLPDAVRRIETLEKTVSRLIDRIGSPRGLDGQSQAHLIATSSKTERKRLRVDSPDSSDPEIDELAQDGLSDVSMAQQRPASDSHAKYVRPSHGTLSTPESPLDAGLVTPDVAQSLLKLFATRCCAFVPFLDVDELGNLLALSSTEPFLLSVVLGIAALYQDPQVSSESSFRRESESHSRLSSHVTQRLGAWLCHPTPSISSVQAVLLVAYWPQAFPGCPDDRLLVGYASDLLQTVALRDQLSFRATEPRHASQLSRISLLWTSLRAFEALLAFDSGRPMQFCDQDVALSKAPRPARSSTPTSFMVRAIPVLKECQLWLSELSLSSLLPVLHPTKPPLPRISLNHDWDRFIFLQTQLTDIEKRWLATETDSHRLERIIGLIDRWGIQIYLGVISLKTVELSSRPSEEAGRFIAAYRREILQSCHVMMDIFTDPDVSSALQYAPGYYLRRFAQTTIAAAALLDFQEPSTVRSMQELIYMCTKRLDQISLSTFTPYVRTLLSHVKHTYDQSVGAVHQESSKPHPPSTLAGQRDSVRWTTTDVFTIFFGAGLLLHE